MINPQSDAIQHMQEVKGVFGRMKEKARSLGPFECAEAPGVRRETDGDCPAEPAVKHEEPEQQMYEEMKAACGLVRPSLQSFRFWLGVAAEGGTPDDMAT